MQNVATRTNFLPYAIQQVDNLGKDSRSADCKKTPIGVEVYGVEFAKVNVDALSKATQSTRGSMATTSCKERNPMPGCDPDLVVDA